MSHFIKSGDCFYVMAENAVNIGKNLPVGTYIVRHEPMQGFFLETTNEFKPLPKYYGDTEKMARRVITTFKDKNVSMGAMFTGEKGSGKTLLAKYISILAAKEEDMPTLIVNSAFYNNPASPNQSNTNLGDKFFKFIADVDQECVIIIDEFEKVFDDEQKQQSILTLLDGMFSSRKLFLLTCNDKFKVNRHLKNRPGRLYYMIDFEGLSSDFIAEYCNEKLNDMKHLVKIQKIAKLFKAFNFDMLQSFVEEVNRYDDDPIQIMTMLNGKPEQDSFGNEFYSVKSLSDNGKAIDLRFCYTRSIHGNPLSKQEIVIEMNDEKSGYDYFMFRQGDITKLDGVSGTFQFTNEQGIALELSRGDSANSNFLGYKKLLQ